ncbi:virulence factor [Brevundimonas balnearis]|uniref:Endoribonuclease VapD n=1 Tax=Brevundimonas balnearis TaxID=1572858 RepID=A0ABV6R495_9CAUL
MFAIAFDLVVAETEARHPKGVSQAYDEIGRTLRRYGFARIQGSVYTTDEEDLANLFAAMNALRAVPWFPDCVRDVRAFRIEQWSDFTPFMKSNR